MTEYPEYTTGSGEEVSPRSTSTNRRDQEKFHVPSTFHIPLSGTAEPDGGNNVSQEVIYCCNWVGRRKDTLR